MTLSAQDEGGPSFPPGSDVYVQATVSTTTPYVGEEVVYTFHYYYLPGVSGTLSEDLPPFEGFWLGEVYELVAPRLETINSQQYSVGELYAVLYPTRAGQFTIDPASLEIAETVFRQGETLYTETVVIDVLPLPDGAPESFNGGVGQLSMESSLEPLVASVGEPLTFSLVLTGSGNLDQLTAPELNLPEDWRAYADPPQYRVSTVSGLRLGEKRYEWLIVPTTAGTRTFVPVTFSYFDPQADVYRTIEANEVQIEVLPAEDGANALFSQPSRPILTMMNVRTSPQPDNTGPGFALILVWVAAPLAFAAVLAWRYGQTTLERREAVRLQHGALARALGRLERIGATASPRAFGQMEDVVIRYASERGNRQLDEPGLAHAVQLCREHTSPEAVASLDTCLREIEAQRYTPPRLLEQESIAILIAALAEAIQQVDAAWSRAK